MSNSFFFSSRRRHTRSVSAFLLNRSSDLANHFYRSAHKFEEICRHRLRRQNVGYSNFSQPLSHLSVCVLLQYLFFFKQKTAYEVGLGIPAEPLFRSRLLEASTMKSRRGFAIQRLMNAMRQAHADGWFIVFDTLTLADDRLEAFYDNPNALRDYFRDIGRMVLA